MKSSGHSFGKSSRDFSSGSVSSHPGIPSTIPLVTPSEDLGISSEVPPESLPWIVSLIPRETLSENSSRILSEIALEIFYFQNFGNIVLHSLGS